MTQIVVAGNWTYAAVVADRRFTVDGVLVDEADDERNKVILVATPTARFAVAFCGLARLGAFATEEWLSEHLYMALAGGGTPDLDLICQRADRDFARLPPVRRPSHRVDGRCVWIVLAGFVSEREGVVPAYAFITNARATTGGYEVGQFHHEEYGPN